MPMSLHARPDDEMLSSIRLLSGAVYANDEKIKNIR